MRVDLITANGKKNSFTRFLIMTAVIVVISGVLLSTLMQFVILLVFSAMTVSSLYQAAAKSDAERMFSVLPVSRKQIVLARFLLAAGLFTAMTLLSVIVMLISVQLKLYVSIVGFDVSELLGLISNVSSFKLAEQTLFLILICTAFWLGMAILSRKMRSYLRTGGKIDDGKKLFRTAKKVLTVIGIFFCIEVVMASAIGLGMQSALFGTLLRLLMQCLMALMQVGNGILLCLILIAAGICAAVYQYISAELEYDEKEL